MRRFHFQVFVLLYECIWTVYDWDLSHFFSLTLFPLLCGCVGVNTHHFKIFAVEKSKHKSWTTDDGRLFYSIHNTNSIFSLLFFVYLFCCSVSLDISNERKEVYFYSGINVSYQKLMNQVETKTFLRKRKRNVPHLNDETFILFSTIHNLFRLLAEFFFCLQNFVSRTIVVWSGKTAEFTLTESLLHEKKKKKRKRKETWTKKKYFVENWKLIFCELLPLRNIKTFSDFNHTDENRVVNHYSLLF